MPENEKPVRAFTQLSRSWYADANKLPGRIDDVMFGLYYRSGGAVAEMSMTWEELRGDTAASIKCYDDAFTLLSECGEVLTALAYRKNHSINPSEFCALLKECGFEDWTQETR